MYPVFYEPEKAGALCVCSDAAKNLGPAFAKEDVAFVSTSGLKVSNTLTGSAKFSSAIAGGLGSIFSV